MIAFVAKLKLYGFCPGEGLFAEFLKILENQCVLDQIEIAFVAKLTRMDSGLVKSCLLFAEFLRFLENQGLTWLGGWAGALPVVGIGQTLGHLACSFSPASCAA